MRNYDPYINIPLFIRLVCIISVTINKDERDDETTPNKGERDVNKKNKQSKKPKKFFLAAQVFLAGVVVLTHKAENSLHYTANTMQQVNTSFCELDWKQKSIFNITLCSQAR